MDPTAGSTDWYQVLGVDPAADPSTIKGAYRRAVKASHPDVGGDPDRFRQVQEAYEVLSDPQARSTFDQARRAPGPTSAPQSGFTGPAAPFDWADPSPMFSAGPVDPTGAANVEVLLDELAERWAVLAGLDDRVGYLKHVWRYGELDSDAAAEVFSEFSECLDTAETDLVESRRLGDRLGVDRRLEPKFVHLAVLDGHVDELGWDVPGRVWFVDWWGLLEGPLWMSPTGSLRARAATWTALVAASWWLLARLADPPASAAAPAAELVGLVGRAPLSMVLAAGAVVGASWWVPLLAVGLARRVSNRWVRSVLGGATAGVLVASVWWWAPQTAAKVVLAGAAAGVVVAALAPLLIAWRVGAVAWLRTVTGSLFARVKARVGGLGRGRRARRAIRS